MSLCCIDVFTGQPCLSGFPSAIEVNNNSCPMSCNRSSMEMGSGRQLRLFPSMIISCTGSMERITVAGLTGEGVRFPIVQVWRPSEHNHFTQEADILLNRRLDCSSSNSQGNVTVRNCTLDPPIVVIPGDILGLVLPRNNQAAFIILFSEVLDSTQHYIVDNTNSVEATIQPSGLINASLPLIRLAINESEGQCL